MSKNGLGIVVGLGVALGALAGCNIEAGDCGPGKHGQFGQDWTQEDEDCVPFCNRLMTCGLVGADREDDCLDFCRNQHKANDSQTHSGCQCVINDSCRTSSNYQCPGAPIPPPDYHATSGSTGTTGWTTTTTTTTTGGTTSGSGTTTASTTATTTSGGSSGGTTTGSTGSAGQCTRNLDCAYNQDCVSGTCMNRCHASCECASGQTCVNGYCASNLPPPQSCTVDCECNAGQTCVNGACQ